MARQAAAVTGLWENVKPWVKPPARCRASTTRPLARTAPTGMYPPLMPLPQVMRSGDAPARPNQAPVRPKPVMTSSSM